MTSLKQCNIDWKGGLLEKKTKNLSSEISKTRKKLDFSFKSKVIIVCFDKFFKWLSDLESMTGHLFQFLQICWNLSFHIHFSSKIKLRNFPSNFWKHVISFYENNRHIVQWFSYLFWKRSWKMILGGCSTITTLVKYKFRTKFDEFSQNCSRHFVYFHSRLARMLPYFVTSKCHTPLIL